MLEISSCHIFLQISFFFYFCVSLLSLDYKDGRSCVNITCTQMGQQSLPLVSLCMCIVEGQVISLCLSASAFSGLLFSKVTLLPVPTWQILVLFSVYFIQLYSISVIFMTSQMFLLVVDLHNCLNKFPFLLNTNAFKI